MANKTSFDVHAESSHRSDDRDGDSVISNDFSARRGGGGRRSIGEGELEPILIAKKKTKVVVRLKVAVGIVLAGSAILLAAAVYFVLSYSENYQFEAQFKGDAHKVLEAVGSSIDKTLGLLDSVAVAFLSSARDNNETWPFVTLQNFAVKMQKILPLTDAIVLNMLPVVKAAQRKEWEAYSLANNGWVNEGMAVQEQWAGYYGPVVYDGISSGVLHSDFENLPYNLSRYHLPLWQNFPVIPNTTWTFNWDWMSFDFPDSYVRSIDHRKAVMAEAFMLPDPGDPIREAETQSWADYYGAYISPEEDAVAPMSDLIYPILDDAIDFDKKDSATNSSSATVGLVVATLYYRDLIRDILPNSSVGMRVVFSICDVNFTYELAGPNADYVGPADVHDAEYDNLRIQSSREFAIRNPKYSGVPIDAEYCDYALYLYPSDRMRASHTSHIPIISTAVVLFIFAFSSLVFVIYDIKVENRQLSVMKTAVRSSEIVSSLFPSAVRDRLYPDSITLDKKATGNIETKADEPASNVICSPIGELYPNTTVMFADLSGFTAWSANRSPEQVFHLLETLYGEFDAIAKKRGVFKVETIGDCYVAVAGLPTPRKSHALVMARFASDCIDKMKELSGELEQMLGSGTGELALRIGLNSGPTMAGVLRGEKSRFQLFGDTVNTAARMESHGERNRIHISQKTAELLMEGGKGHWLEPRIDTVNYKGKGFMKTYWCETKSSGRGGGDDSQGAATTSALDNLIDWSVGVLSDLLRDVVLQRERAGSAVDCVAGSGDEPLGLQLPSTISNQLREFVASIAHQRQTHDSHGFELCCHVMMSINRLLDAMASQHCQGELPADKHNALPSDALAKLAMLFAALIQNVDHTGGDRGTNAAYPTSTTPAWNLFTECRFAELRAFVFATELELERFHVAVATAALASRDHFCGSIHEPGAPSNGNGCRNSMANNVRNAETIALVMQASYTFHAMQHFSIYKKWSMVRLTKSRDASTRERDEAAADDPSTFWYEAELTFFDDHVIPLARMLQTCQLFGTVGDECMSYAQDNRTEWKVQGRDIVSGAKLTLKTSN